MDFARRLLGGSEREHKDFVDRYEQGPGAISGQEAADRYRQVAPQLPPDVYQQSAQDVFSQMTPEQRRQLGQQLIRSAERQDLDFPDVNKDGIDDRLQDPDYLARTTTQLHQQQPGLLDQLFGGGHGGGHTSGGGGMLNSPLAKGVLGGIAAYGASRMLGGHRGHHGHRKHHGHHGGFFGFEGPEMDLGADDLIEGDFGGMDFGDDD